MWTAVAVWFAMTPPVVVPVVNVPFDTKDECISYIIEYSDFDTMVFEAPDKVLLDDGVEDMFGVACLTRTREA